MVHDASASEHGNDTTSPSPHLPADEHGKETSSISPNGNMFPEATLQKSSTPPSELRQNLLMVFITLTQLVQMIPLGAGINSGLAIGEALGATRIESVWIVASYPLTQGAFVLIGKCSPHRLPSTAKWSGMRLTMLFSHKVAVWAPFMVIKLYSPPAVCGGSSGLCAVDSPTTWSPCAL